MNNLKKKLICLGLIAVVGVSNNTVLASSDSIQYHKQINLSKTSDNEEKITTWLVPSKITIGKGEKLPKCVDLPYIIDEETPKKSGKNKLIKDGNDFFGKEIGTCKVYAYDTFMGGDAYRNGKSAPYITVTVKKAPKWIKVPKKSVKIHKGKCYKLKSSVNSGAASYRKTVELEGTAVAFDKEKSVLVGINKGTSKVTIRTYNNKSASFTVTVK